MRRTVKELSDDSYPSDAVNVLTIQHGITFLTTLTPLVTRIQLARPKIKAMWIHYDGNFFEYYTPDTIDI